MATARIYVVVVITIIVIAAVIAIIPVITLSNVTVFAAPLLGQGGNNNIIINNNTATTTSYSSSPSGQQQHTTIHITKDSTNSYVISGQMSSIGSFETTYRVLGESYAINATKRLIISTITSDFRSSPTIGYVRAVGNMTMISSNATLPNPFATPEMITGRITNEITNTISKVANNTAVGQYVEINCAFGMTLQDMRCQYIPLLGTGH